MNYVGSIPKSSAIFSILDKVLRSQTARHRNMKNKKFPSHLVSYRGQHNVNINIALSFIYASQP